MDICRICGGTHKSIDHTGDNVTHSARHDRKLTKDQERAIWNALNKSTKILSKGRLVEI